MALIRVNGVAVSDPAELEIDLMDVSAPDAGRTEDGLMHKNTITKKRKLIMKWPALEKEVAQSVIQVFLPEYISITYYDPYDAATETRTFYTGDKKMPILFWYEDTPMGTRKYYESITVDAIEQ